MVMLNNQRVYIYIYVSEVYPKEPQRWCFEPIPPKKNEHRFFFAVDDLVLPRRHPSHPIRGIRIGRGILMIKRHIPSGNLT
jgi:hypothetical protein